MPEPNASEAGTEPAGGDQPLRCVHYLDAVRLEEGGVVRAVLDLTAAVAASGVSVTLLTTDSTDIPPRWLEGAPGTPRVATIDGAMTPWKTIAGADRSVVAQAIDSADVVHLHTPWDRYNLAAATAARAAGTPYVVSIHGMLDDWPMEQRGVKKRAYLAVAGRRMLEGAARLHFTAEAEREQAMKWAPRGGASVLPLVMDLSPYRELPGPDPARHAFPALGAAGAKLLFLSRVHPKKGIEKLIEAVSLLSRSAPVQCLVAGPGEADYVDQLRRHAGALGVGQCVHFLGMVRGETKLSLYQACDLFVLPTSQENFGIVLTEAMACGAPVVTTRGVDIWKELAGHGAEIVDADATGIAAAAERLLADRETLARRSRQSRDGVFDWLDPDKVTRQYVDLYREVANESRPR
ncbi:MAG: glycosyltransferase [Planctomycetota bacterium]